MSLKDLVNSGVNLGDPMALDRAIENDAAVAASASSNVRVVPEPVNEIEEEEEEEIDAAAAPAASAEPAAEVAAGDDDLEPPVPFGEVAPKAESTDDRIAALMAEIEKLKAGPQAAAAPAPAAPAAPAAAAPSASSQARAALLAELANELGENHILVRTNKALFEDLDRQEAERAETAQERARNNAVTEAAKDLSTQATYITKFPFLNSILDGEDDEMVQIAETISKRIIGDPKLKGTGATKPFTPDHAREVEARLLKRFPDAVKKFYPNSKSLRQPEAPAADGGKKGKSNVVSLSSVKGGAAPVATNVKKPMSRNEAFAAVLRDPSISIDQALQNAANS